MIDMAKGVTKAGVFRSSRYGTYYNAMQRYIQTYDIANGERPVTTESRLEEYVNSRTNDDDQDDQDQLHGHDDPLALVPVFGSSS